MANIKLSKMQTLCISQDMLGCAVVTSNTKISVGSISCHMSFAYLQRLAWRSRHSEQLPSQMVLITSAGGKGLAGGGGEL